MERIFGLLFSGFTVKAAVVIGALYTANYVWTVIAPTMQAVHNGMAVLP